MKKHLFLFVAILAAVAGTMAKPVEPSTANRVASNWLQAVTGKTHDNLTDITAQTPFQEFYVFTLGQEGGFILIAADDCVLPVLGYSETSTFPVEDIPAHIMEWMKKYDEQIAFYREHYGEQPYGGSDEVRRQWKSAISASPVDPPLPTAVSPLLSTTWNQSPYYNNLCPSGTYTGCAATAAAQIMKYWNHPATGYGSHAYVHSAYGTLSANFGNTTYNWSNMPSSLTSSSSSAQVNAVATLMYHIGVAIEMTYGTDGSSAATASFGNAAKASCENAFPLYFKYKPTARSIYRAEYSDAEWSALLVAELDAQRPILYTGFDVDAGHAFVFDGYNSQGQFHVNWGWNGYCDGYYTIGALNPSTGGQGGNTSGTYNLNNYALIGIEPNTAWSSSATTTVNASVSNTAYGSVTGAGTYSFGDTINLGVSTNLGCRFYGWNDGNTIIHRGMIATGGTLNLTANIGPLSGDTLGYCFNTRNSSRGFGSTGNNLYWGILLPASKLPAGHQLTTIQYYVDNPGTYDLTVYTGSSPSTVIYTQTYTLSSTGWTDLPLTTPVTADGTQNFWIFFHNTDVAYPMTLSSGCGNNYASLYTGSDPSQAGSLQSLGANESHMIRAIFTDPGSTPGPGPTPVPTDCSNPIVLTIGDTTSTNTAIQYPVNNYYKYTLSETIIDAAELQGMGQITSISYRYNHTSASSSKNDVTIWIQPTTKTAFSSNSDIETLNTANAVMVYSGELNCSQGWNEFLFTTPYNYDGTSNLMIIVDDNSNAYNSNSHTFNTAACSDYKTLVWYSDSQNPDPTSSSYSGTKQYYQARVQMRLNGCQPGGDITVADGTDNNSYVPVYGYYADAFLRCQTIYPATSLASSASAQPMQQGASITSLTYYLATPASEAMDGTFVIKLSEVSNTTLSSFLDVNNATTVYTGTLDASGSEMTINFTTPYTYNGGNLLVEVTETVESSNYPSASYLGVTTAGASWQGYDYSSVDAITGSGRNFMPKTTFTYTGGNSSTTPSCAPPVITIDSVVGRRVWFSWSSEGDSVFLTIKNHNGQQVYNQHFPANGSIDAAGLSLPESYFPFGNGFIYGMSLCNGTDTSNWVYEEFPVTCEVEDRCPMTIVLNDDWGDGWNGGALDIYDSISGLLFTSITCPNHGNNNIATSDTIPIYLCPERVYRVAYRAGQYDEEVSFQILGSNGDTLINVSDPSAGTQGYFTHTCGNGTNCVVMSPVIGDTTSTSTSYYTPINNYFKYTLSETIIDAAEIGGPMTINSISYYYNYATASTKKTNCTIYLQPTSKSVFASSSDIELLDPTTAVMVYSGELNCQQGWNTFTFTTPYYYDGEDNLMVIVDDNSNDYDGNSYNFRTTDCTGYKTLYWYSDSQNPDPTSSTFSGSKSWSQARVVMSLNGCQAAGVTCPKPAEIAETHASYSATVTWSSSASNYSVTLIDASGATLNYSTTTNTTKSFTSLTPNTDYTVVVRALCSTTDSSTAKSISFRTNCATLTAADLPYTEDFESYASGSSATISPCWTKGTNASSAYPYPSTTTITGARTLYFYGYKPSSATGTSTYSYAALPELAASVDVSDLTISFNARRYSNTGANYRSILYVGVMTDPTDVSTFMSLSVINMTPMEASTIENYRVNLANYTGTGKYVAFYCPAVDTAGSNYSYNHIYIDDVVLDFTPNCHPVSGLTTSNVTNSSATLTWADANNTGATYTVYNATGSVIASGITSNSYTITGLTGQTDYTFSVVANCSATDASPATTVAIHTLPDPIMCGNTPALVFANAENATGTTNYFPGYSLYNYSYSEVIIPSTQLLGLGEIKGMEFYVNTLNTGSDYFNNCEIYLMNSTATSLADGFIQDSTGFQLVYSGSLNQNYTGWNLVTFNNTFLYDGTSNLIVAVLRGHGSWASSGSFGSYTATDMLARYVYNDNNAYTLGSITGGTAVTNVPVYRMLGCEGMAPDCMPVRNLTVDAVTPNSVTLSWADTTNSGATYTVMNDSTVVASGISTTTYTVTGLTAETSYTFSVVANCSATSSSLPITVGAFTGYCTPSPTSVDNNGITSVSFGGMTNTTHPTSASYANYSNLSGSVPAGTTATVEITYATGYTYGTIIWVDWNNNMVFEGNEVVYVGTSTNDNPTVLTATFNIPATQALGNYRMRILGADNYFDSYVTSIAAAANADPCASFSWGVAEDYTLTVTAPVSCAAVTDVTASDITATGATLSWTDTLNNGVTYSVLNATGAAVATGLTTMTYTLTGLTAETAYTFGVVANCSANEASVATTVSFTTAAVVVPDSLLLTVAVNDATMGTTSPVPGTYVYHTGDTVTVTATPNSGYRMAAWVAPTVNGNNVVENDTIFAEDSDFANPFMRVFNLNQSVAGTLTALFAPVITPEPCLAVTNLAVDTVTQTSVTVSWTGTAASYSLYRDGVHVTNVTATSYTFTGLTAATSYTFGVASICSATDSAALVTVNASTEANVTTYTVTATVNDSTMGAAYGGGVYTAGDMATLTAVAYDGYHFVNWTEFSVGSHTMVGTDTVLVIPVTGNMSLMANFEADTMPVVIEYLTLVTAVNNTSMGTMTPAPGTYSYAFGDSIHFSATPNEGYYVMSVGVSRSYMGTTVDDTVVYMNDVSMLDMVVEQAMLGTTVTVTVNFAPETSDEAVLTVTVNDDAMGYVLINGSRAATYEGHQGDSVTLEAVAGEGFVFQGWSDGSGDAVRTIELQQHVTTLEATFVHNESIDVAGGLDNLKVYPNPTSGMVNIEAADVVNVEVLDINGRLAATFENTNQIDISRLSVGTYMLRIQTLSGNAVRRVVKR
ncbi:MAG: C10 family peptidase [Bacteroidales bacterium]|nr:C10 family peptidase [Bacteroidales bacterium]